MDRDAATVRRSPRCPSTVCVYCGERIPGRDYVGDTHNPGRDRYRRWAALFTCPRHGDLPHLDPVYMYLLGKPRVW